MSKDMPDYSKYGFLIADDKAFIRGLIQSVLLKCQVRNIKHANSGDEAMGLLSSRASEIDCVVSDWSMDPINGLELLKFVRSGAVANTRADLPFIMLTGHADADVVKTALALDVHGYLVKPVSMEKLVQTLGRAFEKRLEPKPAEEYLSVPLKNLPNTCEGPARAIAPWVFWPRTREKRQELAQRMGQIRREVLEQLKKHVQSGEKRRVVNPRTIRLSDAVPGTVLATDLFTPDGTLLLGAGVVLTESLISRLHAITAENEGGDTLTIGDLVTS